VRGNLCQGPDGTVYAGSWDGGIYAQKNDHTLWKYHDFQLFSPTRSIFEAGTCLGADGTVYAVNFNHKVYAVKDGRKIWEFEGGDEFNTTPSVGPDGTVYAGCRDGNLYAVKDGRKLWEVEVVNGIKSVHIFTCTGPDGTVYAACRNRLIAVKDGVKRWDYGLQDPVETPIRMGPANTLLVYDREGGLRMLRLPEATSVEELVEEVEAHDSKEANDAPEVHEDENWLIIDEVKLEKSRQRGLSSGKG